MPDCYKIFFFEKQSGECPIEEYMFSGNNEDDVDVIIAVIQRLAYSGLSLQDTKMAKHIEHPIYELRKDRHRIMFAVDHAADKSINGFIVLSGFLKDTQETRPEHIEAAKTNWAEYKKFRKRNQPFKIPLNL